MNLTKIYVLLLTFISLNQIYAGDSLKIKNSRIWDEVIYDAKVFISDGAAFYTAPFRFNSKEWLYTGAGIVSLGIIMSQDRNLKTSLSKGNKSGDLWSFVKNYGDVKYAGIGSGIIYLTGLVSRSKVIRETGRMLLQSLVYSGSITILLKTITGRSRPYFTESQYDFNWFEKSEEKLSFPSGHSTVAFAISTVLAEKIDTWWSRAGFYSLAALTAYSRVHDNQHWVSDAVFGSLIGFSSGYFVVHVNNNRNKIQKFSFSPSLNGIAFQYKF
jgi:membrane-associated phospholipid phosphatase